MTDDDYHDDDGDVWGDGLDDLVNPLDNTTNDDSDAEWTCRWCPQTFTTKKSLSLHETGSHRLETCTVCGDRVGIRGMSNHTQWCQYQASGAFDDILPTAALRARLRDWLERASEAVHRDDVYCMVCEGTDDPEFVRDIALVDRLKGRGMCWLFPANKISARLFQAPARRDRRTGFATKSDEGPVLDQDRLEIT